MNLLININILGNCLFIINYSITKIKESNDYFIEMNRSCAVLRPIGIQNIKPHGIVVGLFFL